MNWYKESDISSFKDRNDINVRIKEFKDIITKLESMSDAVFQNSSRASGVIKTIYDDKKMSSFPKIKTILHDAYTKALDSPKTTGKLCIDAVDLLVEEMEKMEADRKKFIEETNPNNVKERVTSQRPSS